MKKKETPKLGRPKLPKGEAKTETLRFRLTPSEMKRIESSAKAAGAEVSEWARLKLLEN
jgi:hypothetical protein